MAGSPKAAAEIRAEQLGGILMSGWEGWGMIVWAPGVDPRTGAVSLFDAVEA